MQHTPKNLRLHIGLFGRRNVGKSSLVNVLTGQQTAIVSPVPGTTTDPVEKAMEFQPIGPVEFIDTAGIDDEGDLGALRVAKTRRAVDRTDLGLLVYESGRWTPAEEELLAMLRTGGRPCVVVANKVDETAPGAGEAEWFTRKGIPFAAVSAATGAGIPALREAIVRAIPEEFIHQPPLLADLVAPGRCAVLVVPIDKEAPKGRLILPQAQAIRELLDADAWCLVVKERELGSALGALRASPAIVVTDSQAFLKVAADTPPDVPMTSFSILFARRQGDLMSMVRGAMAVDRLQSGDRVLIAEACTHHPITEDIGTVKIPRWLRQYTGRAVTVEHVRGHDFPDDPSGYRLVIHCGACMWNRREMLSRIMQCERAGVPITNYGLVIAYTLGIFERALSPFPAVREEYRKLVRGGGRDTA
jgi:[FeFe] hydrogenase H-cluster maturation GTPase HydF